MRLFALLGLSMVFWSASCAGATETPPGPNVVVIIADDIGIGDLGFSGAKDIPTPHLDRLAGGGVIFRQGYVSPMCAPTRAAFMTGRYPEKIGFEDNRPGDTQHFGLDLSLPTLADILKEKGYATCLVGKWHLGRGLKDEYSPWNRGFQHFVGYFGAFGTYENPALTFTEPPLIHPLPGGKTDTTNAPLAAGLKPSRIFTGYSTGLFGDAACAFIRQHANRPFFLNVAFNAAHLKQIAKPEDLEKFQHVPNVKRRTAAAIISNLDSNIGRIASTLKELQLDHNTLLVFFSDNGGEPPILGTSNGALRGMKFDVYEGGIRVPFFVRWPAALPAGKTFDDPVSVIDLLPSIAAATGARVPQEIDGVDLLPHMRHGSEKPLQRALYWRTTQHASLQDLRRRPKASPPVYVPHIAAVRQENWKLVVMDHGGRNPNSELYDVIRDPSETNDLSRDQSEVARRLGKLLDGFQAAQKPQVIPPRR